MNLPKPIGDRILVKAAKTETESKIVIPETVAEKPRFFEVVRVGTKRKHDEPFDVQPGDIVLVALFGGTDIRVDGQDFRIITSDDILAKYEQ